MTFRAYPPDHSTTVFRARLEDYRMAVIQTGRRAIFHFKVAQELVHSMSLLKVEEPI
jgi:hypothetical protein